MACKKKFSVLMSVYKKDSPQWLEIAVSSVLNQTVKPAEIVLVVDGPVSEELNSVIKQYEKNDIFKIIRLEENKGLGTARRVGMENCTYEIVAVMDADDISLPDRFEKQLKKFEENTDLSIVGGNIAEFIDLESNIVGYRNVPSEEADIKTYIKTRCPFNHMTVMLKKADVEKVGGYMDWFWNEDYYLWIRMYLADMRFANIPEVLVNVRVGNDMYKRRGGWKYFRSELGIQNYMLANNMIGLTTYVMNVLQRFILQVMMPNSLRGFIFKKFARTQNTN